MSQHQGNNKPSKELNYDDSLDPGVIDSAYRLKYKIEEMQEKELPVTTIFVCRLAIKELRNEDQDDSKRKLEEDEVKLVDRLENLLRGYSDSDSVNEDQLKAYKDIMHLLEEYRYAN